MAWFEHFPPNCWFLSPSTKNRIKIGDIYFLFQERRQGLRRGSRLQRQTAAEEWDRLGIDLSPQRLKIRPGTWKGSRPRPRRRLTPSAPNMGRDLSSTHTWLNMKVHTREKSSLNLKCVRAPVILDTTQSARERRVIGVSSVGKLFREAHTLSDIRKPISVKSLISARSAKKYLVRMRASWNISESTLERGLFCASTVERTLGAALT